MSNAGPVHQAAEVLAALWQQRTRCHGLALPIRPRDRKEGYAVQQALTDMQPYAQFGWKIAATSAAGQAHIGVDGPLAGRLYTDRVLQDGAQVSLHNNLMLVAEIEFTFRFARTLTSRDSAYTVNEVLDAVACVHPSIEIPDSRYDNFVSAGAPQLIADNACANLFVLGPRADDWRGFDYVDEAVSVMLNGQSVDAGYGRNVLADPRIALTWLVNEVSSLGMDCAAGQVVTTGTCRIPLAVKPGDQVLADFGRLGKVSCRFI